MKKLEKIILSQGIEGVKEYYANKITVCITIIVFLVFCLVFSLNYSSRVQHKKDKLIISQNARIEFLERIQVDSLEVEYVKLTDRCKDGNR